MSTNAPMHSTFNPMTSNMDTARTASIINAICGAWLIIAPVVLSYTEVTVATWNSVAIGAIVLIVGWVKAANTPRLFNLAWINLLAGLWLTASPFMFEYGSIPTPTWNNIVMGVVVVILAAASLVVMPSSTGNIRTGDEFGHMHTR